MFSKRLVALRKQRKMTQEELADALGISRPALSHYEQGRREPDFELVQKMAAFFGVSTDYLLGLTDDPTPRPRIESENEVLEIEGVLRIPLLGYIAAGNPIFADEHIEEWIEYPNIGRKYREGELFALRVKGDSMIGSRIWPGDVVIVRVQEEVADGEIAVVNVDGENAVLKRVRRVNGQYILYSDNPNYEPIIVSSDRARICGKVIQVFFDPNKKITL